MANPDKPQSSMRDREARNPGRAGPAAPEGRLGALPLSDLDYVNRKLDWMEAEGIWPNGLRYLWTDAFGLVLYLSLFEHTGHKRYLDKAIQLVDEVYRVLGRDKGIRIGEAPERDGQYYHYLAMWLFALARLGDCIPDYRDRGVALAKDIHPRFVLPGRGVIWKMREDLSAPCPGFGLGAMDAYDGYIAYRLLDEKALASEIDDMAGLMENSYRHLEIDQDLGLGMMLWLCHFFPAEDWAVWQQGRSLQRLDRLWVDPPGYFCRQSDLREVKFAFTNYGISLGLQAAGASAERVAALNGFFNTYRSGDEYDRNAITHVMACTSHFPGLFLRSDAAPPEGDESRPR